MPQWILSCTHCSKDFEHSRIDAELFGLSVLGRSWIDKPFFPVGGEDRECPHCHQSARYQRFMLRYKED